MKILLPILKLKNNMQEIKYKGNYITVTEEDINGHIFERVKLRKGVHLIPYREENKKILLIYEERIHEHKPRWKLVSGWVDKENKSVLEHAQEELAEEIGYSAEYWQEVYSTDREDLTISPSTYFFVCQHLTKLEHPPLNPDSGRVLTYEWFSFDEIFQMLSKDQIKKDGSIMVALSFLYDQIHTR